MNARQNQILQLGEHNGLLYDIYLPEKPVALVFFMHGFKGFKDWGHFDYIAKSFMNEEIAFVKFNFSHNGVGLENPLEFTQLEKFAQNTLSRELNDLLSLEDYLLQSETSLKELPIFYIGHSRGAGIGIIAAAAHDQKRTCISWAGVSDYNAWFSKFDLEQWRSDGLIKIPNARTGQLMPMNYEIVMDLKENTEKLSIQKACESMEAPMLIIQGTEDPAVSVSEARNIYEWTKNAELVLVEGAQHTFNVSHPFDGELALEAQLVIDQSIDFVKNNAKSD